MEWLWLVLMGSSLVGVIIVVVVIMISVGRLVAKSRSFSEEVGESIVENRQSVIELVPMRLNRMRELEASGDEYNIGFTHDDNIQKNSLDLLGRARNNPFLAQALKKVKELVNLPVYGAERFWVQSLWIDVDVRASDQEIIEFLVGKQE